MKRHFTVRHANVQAHMQAGRGRGLAMHGHCGMQVKPTVVIIAATAKAPPRMKSRQKIRTCTALI